MTATPLGHPDGASSRDVTSVNHWILSALDAGGAAASMVMRARQVVVLSEAAVAGFSLSARVRPVSKRGDLASADRFMP